jgi:hypothetical protein
VAGKMQRVGVTGHRSYDNPAAVDEAIATAVQQLGAAGDRIEIWSSLAEGADRAVAHAALKEPNATLVAVLPLCANDYRDDFADSESCDEFEALLARASRVIVTGGDDSGEREAAYERAGFTMLDGVNALIAVWDGQPSRGRGGTAEIVAEAQRRRLSVLVIPVTRPANDKDPQP